MKMQATFHWLRVQAFCYATEREDVVAQTFAALTGTDEFETEVSDSEHGNRMIIFQYMLTKQKDLEAFFRRLGPSVLQHLLDDIDNRIDDDCVFYTRLDKQQAVQGVYAIAHHGDVISVTGKVASNPARKDIAESNLRTFLSPLLLPPT